MKRIKKLISILAAAAVMTVVPAFTAMHADAATPTTFYLKYDTDKHDWRLQVNEWLNDYEGKELYYLNNGSEKANDGDVVVILANEEQEAGSKGISVNAHLSNLTVNRSSVVISANGIDNCYVLGESYAAISGNVTNAYVYDEAKCTFNNNVTNLHLVSTEKPRVHVSVSVVGTVGYAAVEGTGGITDQYYNFKANTFYYDRASALMTKEENYSKDGSAPAAATVTETPAATTTAPAAAATTSNSGDYDDVPKTGEGNLSTWLLVLSGICLAGAAITKKQSLR